MKQPIRYFSIGLATAALLIFVVYSFFDNQPTQTEEKTMEQKIEDVKEQGYRVLSESEYINLAVNSEDNSEDEEIDDKEKEDKNENKDQEKDQDTESDEEKQNDKDEATTYTLHVKPNMLGPEISDLLFENDIIDDAGKFTQLLEDDGYSEYIQLGKHRLSSDMDMKEVAKAISNQ